jgi:hypothetical protein
MGGCSSKVVPVISLLPSSDTGSRAVSYSYDDVVSHVYKKEKYATAIKSEFDTYKRNLRTIECIMKSDKYYLLTEEFYIGQENIKARMDKLFECMAVYDEKFVKVYRARFKEFEKSYRGFILYLYMSDKLTIDEVLIKREDVRSFFGIRKKVVSFSQMPTII